MFFRTNMNRKMLQINVSSEVQVEHDMTSEAEARITWMRRRETS